MIGVVLAAHGDVAAALLKAAEAIVGPLEAVEAIRLQAGEDPDFMRGEVVDAVHRVDDGAGVLILCDMFGGTPSNVCLSAECGTPVEVVTGVNLPMVLKLATARAAGAPVRDAARQIAEYGQRHITHATELLRERRNRVASAGSPSRPPPARDSKPPAFATPPSR
jgi:PTS system mannose-specific IIA component